MTQDKVFSEGEGDRWFRRNEAAISDPERLAADPVLRLIEMAGLKPSRACEIGASNGYRLHALRERYGCEAVAVEPSEAAIADGRARYPDVVFHRGVAGEIPIAESFTFDLVIVNFVFHWIDRSTLMQSASEIDRMLQDGGFLVIGDFFSAYPERVHYHHLPDGGVATYKQPYGEMFLATNLYEPVAAVVVDHATHHILPDVAPENRAQVVLLRKTLQGRYASRRND